MALAIVEPELFGVTADSITLSFVVVDGAGPVAAPARVLVDDDARGVSQGPAGTRLVRVTGLAPGREYRIDIAAAGAPSSRGGTSPASHARCPRHAGASSRGSPR